MRSFGERQLGDGEPIFDRAGPFFGDLGREEIAEDALRLVLAFDGGRHDLVERGLHAVEVDLPHQFEELGAFHHMVLQKAS